MRIPLLILMAVSLQACASTWESDGPYSPAGGTGITANDTLEEGPSAVSSISQLPTRNATGATPPFATRGEAAAYEYGAGYRVGAGDRLSIRVAGETDLSGDYVVDPSGVLSMPYVQSVSVAGMTSAQIERVIVQRLQAGYLRDPKVSVQAVNLRPFYIMGEVTTAGSFPYQGGLTIQQAIATAGGYSARADHGHVLLTRRTANGTKTYKVPVTTQVYPGDIVFVRERWF
ncbi:MAG: polysaccharide export protein [Rhizobiales bacterium]|nr:polysaccharide export protein [Hyphomicrobiales bacterium]